MTEERIVYPLKGTLEIYITDGNQVGSVKYGTPFGKLPLDSEMDKILEDVKKAIPEGFRLMDRAESFMQYIREEKGYRGPNLVIPHLGKWHDPATDKDHTYLNDEPDFDEEEY